MIAIHIRLTSCDYPSPTAADAARVHDALWARTPANSGLEHIRARAGPNGIDVVFFIRDSGSLHFGGAADLPDALCEGLRALHSWQLSQPS